MDMEQRLIKIESKQEETEKRVNELDKNGALFQQALEGFKIALDKFDKTTSSFQESIHSMNLRITGVEKEVKEDCESIENIRKEFTNHTEAQKLDIVKVAKDNALSVALVIYIILNHLGILKF